MEKGFRKYTPFQQINIQNRKWPDNTITKAPVWCSVDLRDGTPFPEALRRLRERTAAVTLSEDCATCAKHSHCCVCPAMLYTESGSFDRVPHYLCRFTKELIRLASEEPIPEGLTGNPETIRNEGAEELC